jgi:hypothetical protein
MMIGTNWKEIAITTAFFVVFTLIAVKHGWTQIDAFGGNVDPSVFIREAQEIVRTGELITSRDPPARYFPLALLYTLTQPHGVLAERIASLHAAIFSFVVLPAGIACLAYAAGNRTIAYLSLIIFGVTRFVGFGTSGFQTGAWQYDIATPLVFVSLAAVHQSLTTTGAKADQWAIGAGVTLGLVGMTQWTLTLFAISIASVAYIVLRRYRNLLMTGVTGAVFATYLFFLPPSSSDLMFAGFANRILPDSGALIQLSHILAAFSSPGFWLTTIGGLMILIFLFRQRQVVTGSGVLMVAIGVLYPVYLASALLNVNYIGWVVIQILLPVLYITGNLIVSQNIRILSAESVAVELR